jgi:hypothetical protein
VEEKDFDLSLFWGGAPNLGWRLGVCFSFLLMGALIEAWLRCFQRRM